MSYDFIRPANIRSQSGWESGGFFSLEHQREIILRRDGQDSFNEQMHGCVLHWLQHGFAVPNASIAWSILFSALSDEQYEALYSFRRLRPAWCDVTDTFKHFSEPGWKMDGLKIHLFEKAMHCAISADSPSSSGWSEAEMEYCRTLPLINVGLETDRTYMALEYACRKLMDGQLGGKADLRAMANPTALRRNIHQYIDRLVFLNNEVQRYCRYIRETPCEWDVARCHQESLSDDDFALIAASPPAVMFTQAISGGARVPRPSMGRRGELCPV